MEKRMKLFLLVILCLTAFNLNASKLSDTEKIDKQHWLYFGWEEDHPKAISLMGGALYARRPKLQSHDDHSWEYSKEAWHPKSSEPVFFKLGVDGSLPYYPDEQSTDRRENIKWFLAESFLPFPVSQWEYNKMQVEITHLGRRLLANSVNVVYTQVKITNVDTISHRATLFVIGESVRERVFPLKKISGVKIEQDCLTAETKLLPGRSRTYEFFLPANGKAEKEDILRQGDFAKQYVAEKSRILSKMDNLTMPVSLPNEAFVDLWKSSMVHMWNATVKTPIDYEQRGSGGNVYGYYQYDRVFDHDVPDMVIQYILEGNWDIARNIMEGATYERLSTGKLTKEAYLDAIPKYLITMAQYLQMTGDINYFDGNHFSKLKKCVRAVCLMREGQMNEESKQKGVYGLIQKGHTLDNNAKTYLIVDNFAALHGFAAYKYICHSLGKNEEVKWITKEMDDLNNCLNAAIQKSTSEVNTDWYNACFSFDMDYHLSSGPGNWLGTTFMMPSFPWNAYLKGFDLKGSWAELLDNSVAKWIEVARNSDCPEGSLGAWWGAKYGSVYNTGMVMPLLYSQKYRTMVSLSIEWLLQNQTGPYIWGESFHKPEPLSDWTRPEVDLETWGLGFLRQAMLQMCLSAHVDGTLIIGRGIPNEWLNSEKSIAWKNIRINEGKKVDLRIQKIGKTIKILLAGDDTKGNIVIDFPLCVSNIKNVSVLTGKWIQTRFNEGQIIVSGDTKEMEIQLMK